MKTKLFKSLVIMLVFLFIISAFASASSLTEEKMDLRYIGASPGGTYFIVLGGLSETLQQAVPNWSVTVEPGSTMSDIVRVAQGDGDLALSQHTAVLENMKQREVVKEKIRSIGAIATSAAQFIMGKHVEVDTFEEFVNQKPQLRVSFGPPSEVHWAGIKRLLGEYELSPEDVLDWNSKIYYKEMGAATDMYSSGGLDGYFLIALTPTAPTSELAFDHDLKMLKVDEEVIDSLVEKYNYAKVTLPANTYDFIEEPIKTFAAKTITVVSSDMPDEVAYNIVKSLLNNIEDFRSRHAILKNIDIDYMIETNGVPLHPGAIKAYKEAGADL